MPVWFSGLSPEGTGESLAPDQDPWPAVGSILGPARGIGIPRSPNTLGGQIDLSGKKRSFGIDYRRIQI